MIRSKHNLTPECVHLRPWDEVVGTLTDIETNDTETVMLLTCTVQKRIVLIIDERSLKKEKFEEQAKKLVGRKISILKTDDPQEPPIVRIISEPVCESPEDHTKSVRPDRVSSASPCF